MREIKFRAWDGERFYRWGIRQSHVLNYVNGNDLPIDQYTGLKDKNGVEIYEGDIVLIADNLLEVKWIRNSFQAHNSHKDYELIGSNLMATTVIGNIYENPELLGGGGDE